MAVVAVVVVNWRGGSGVGGGINPAVLPAASQHLDTFHTDGESPLETRGT